MVTPAEYHPWMWNIFDHVPLNTIPTYRTHNNNNPRTNFAKELLSVVSSSSSSSLCGNTLMQFLLKFILLRTWQVTSARRLHRKWEIRNLRSVFSGDFMPYHSLFLLDVDGHQELFSPNFVVSFRTFLFCSLDVDGVCLCGWWLEVI